MTKLCCVFASIFALSVASTVADLVMESGKEPFLLNESIIGKGGWQNRLVGNDENLESAQTVPVNWDDNKPAVSLRSASLKNIFPRTAGDRVKVSFDIAIESTDTKGRGFRLGLNDAPFGEIYFAGGEGGGLGYQGDGNGRTGGKILIPINEFKTDSYYSVTFLVNFSAQTYDVQITGEKSDGTPFEFRATEERFPDAPPKLNPGFQALYLLSAPSAHVYLRRLEITQD